MKKTTFAESVVEIARSIPSGRVMTYGGIARAAGGGAMAAQSITAILGKAYYDKGIHGIPFHRIVYADGRVWINEKHRKKRLQLYKQEGIKLDEKNRIVDFQDTLIDL